MAWIQPAFQDTKTSLSNPPPLARAHHTLTWLPGSLNDLESKDSRRKCAVLIGGANRETLLADTHVLSHQDGQWKWEELRLAPSGSRNALTPRARHSAVAIQGKLFVFGGIGGGEAVFSLDVEAKRWLRLKTTGRGPCARFAHAATSVQNIMYIIGGHTGTWFVNDVFCLDTLTRRWSQVHIQSSVRLPPSLHWTACTVMGSKILVFGGALGTPLEDAYVLRQPDRASAESNERALENMSLSAQSSANEAAGKPPSPRYQHSCTLTFDANAASDSSVRLCIMGGFGYTSQSSFDNASAVEEARMRVAGPLKDVFIFDVRLRTWSEAKIAGEALPPLWRHAAFSRASQPSELIIFGGTRRKRDHNENEFPPTFEDCNEIWRLDSTWESPTQALLSM
ncbi:Kelch domain-containing protein 1 [Hondaea fermentalgiana]|uniref:Kelch domain-containing protein 1 n=1 Tax=Hondaea fermentalgiana TaxID=2315210 RepID=A0A2R5GBR1_9STRA|nr:Kelch domain-containing protein 1 [Hondaea fermentalgiana]|eukprot:GBG26013.1 Kelch domain-containing protein 1 [Hondaea fermentalgiana]